MRDHTRLRVFELAETFRDQEGVGILDSFFLQP